MSKRNSKKKQAVQIPEVAPRSGHYDYKDSRCTFDNRPKRKRTRGSQKRFWIENDWGD